MKKSDKMDKNRNIRIRGIVNLTDDSYFAESRCLGGDGNTDLGKAIGRIRKMLGEGADIIDIGAASSRPGADEIPEKEEWKRLRPVLEEIRVLFPALVVSIDTYRASIVRKTAEILPHFIVNDISAGEDDPEMLGTAGETGAGYVAMHKKGSPKTMQDMCDYVDVTEEVSEYFMKFAEKAEKAGIKEWILDPGFGFAKTIDQNYELLSNLHVFRKYGRQILAGMSRKSMIYRKFGITPEESLPATQVLHFSALQNGADILRVHDVAEAARTVALYRIL